MSVRVGIGYSEQSDSAEAGAEAMSAALVALPSQAVHLVLIFSTARHQPSLIYQAIRRRVGPQARIVGGYAVGIITNNNLAYDGYQVGVAAFSMPSIQCDIFVESGLIEDEHAVGQALGQQIAQQAFASDPQVLLFYDSVNRTGKRFKLNMATPLLAGLRSVLSPLPTLAGAGLVGDMQCRETFQWVDDRILQHAAIALAFSGNIRMDTVVMHGCHPVSSYHTITKTDGASVLEIDGRPALDVVADLLGPDSNKSWRDYGFFVTLGLNKGDKWGAFSEDDYANRMCMRVDKERRALVMFEPDLHPGVDVQLMHRSIDFKYIYSKADALLEKIKDRRAIFAFYIDCAGRAAAYAGIDDEEAAAVQRAIGTYMPLLGIYSGTEIGPIRQIVQPLDWTGVLCVFSEDVAQP